MSLPIEQVHAKRISNVFMISTVIFEGRQLQDLVRAHEIGNLRLRCIPD